MDMSAEDHLYWGRMHNVVTAIFAIVTSLYVGGYIHLQGLVREAVYEARMAQIGDVHAQYPDYYMSVHAVQLPYLALFQDEMEFGVSLHGRDWSGPDFRQREATVQVSGNMILGDADIDVVRIE